MSDYSNRTNPTAGQPGDVARAETAALISSDKVEGTSVYDRAGNNLGTIHSVMIGKQDGKVAYAVLSFGGFLGVGQTYFPIPWSKLSYDERHDGYVTDVTEAQLSNAPTYGSAESNSWSDNSWRGAVDTHYRSPTI